MFTKPVITFCLLTFAISWGVFFSLLPFGVFKNATTFAIGAFAFMWGPAISALICAKIYDKGRVVQALALTPKFNKWMILAWGAPLVICIASVLFSLLGPDVHLVPLREGLQSALGDKMAATGKETPNSIGLIMVLSAISIGAGINGVLLISEELGWRGFLWNKIIEHGFWKAALFTGIIWGFWHAPLIVMGHNYPGMPIAGIFIMALFTTLMSPIIGYIRLKNGSVWAASLFHGTVNAVASLSIFPLSVQKFPWNGMVGIGGMIALLLGCIWVWLALRKMSAHKKA